MATPRVFDLPQPSLFTLAPSHLAGRRALGGFEFQANYISYVLAGFIAGKEDFVSCRVEAVQDLDALVRVDEIWIERYYQIKSKQEGGGAWTLNRLDSEGVLASFFSLFRTFRSTTRSESRRIELAVVVDGDLDSRLVTLRDEGVAATNTKAELFTLLCSAEVISKQPALGSSAQDLRDCFRKSAHLLLANATTRAPASLLLGDDCGALAKRTGRPADATVQTVLDAADAVAPLLDEFVASLRFESRVGSSLDESTFARLVESGDLSPAEALTALGRLKRSVQDESALPKPTLINDSVLRGWLGIPRRMLLQSKPALGADGITRKELIEEISSLLSADHFILLHGLSKVGKSQFVSALIGHDHKDADYFWYTFVGDPSDPDRLAKQLAVWAGTRTGKWQIKDDLETAGLSPLQAFERLGSPAITGVYIVLDDCHKCTDHKIFESLWDLLSHHWPDSRLVLISERRIPAAAVLGAREVPLGGFTERESLLFFAKLGVYIVDAFRELALLAVQIGGHPIMLRAAASELPRKPAPADVLGLSQRIPSMSSAEAFLTELSNRLFFDLLRTADQRVWVARIAAVSFPVTQGLAIHLAELNPALPILTADWDYLKSLLLDETSADHYSVPRLLQEVASKSTSTEETARLKASAARYVFRAAIASRAMDFWDYQFALIALVAAGRHDEAAMRFVLSFSSLMTIDSFKPLELLFLLLNDEQVHAKIREPASRWFMLKFEVQMRLLDKGHLEHARLGVLIRRLHSELVRSRNHALPFARPMLHLAIASIRMRTVLDTQRVTGAERRRIFVPLEASTRTALATGDMDLVANLLCFYNHQYSLATRPDIELFKDALVAIPRSQDLPVSAHTLTGMYAKYVMASHHSDAAMQLVESHGDMFRNQGRTDAYVACELAAALILHDGRSRYSEARERLELLLSAVVESQLSPDSLAHCQEFIAGTFWAEGKYAQSAEYYRMVLNADLDSPGRHQIVCERLCDSLIFLGRYVDAAQVALAQLRSGRAEQEPVQRARLYARLAYAYAEQGALRKAAISCLGLNRVAAKSRSEPLRLLAGVVAGWVLGHFTYRDPAIPKSSTKLIRDCSALSDDISEEELAKWRASDPFGVKGFVVVGAVFELLEDWRRAGSLYCQALGTVLRSEENARLVPQTAGVYYLLIARIHLREGRLCDAARELKAALEHSLAHAEEEQPRMARAGTAIYAWLEMADPPLRACSDDKLCKFFDLLNTEFSADAAVRAWLCYKESGMLFDRLAVQAAKRRLAEAMDLASPSSEPELYWLIVQQSLFYRVDQTYMRADSWLQDTIRVAVTLADHDTLATYRQSFAESVSRLARGSVGTAARGPLWQIVSEVDRFEGEWQQHAFLVASYGLWRAGSTCRVLSGSRNRLEAILRAQASFLAAPDFD